MSKLNPYTVLGVERDADAATIKRAYRSAMKAWHPDVNDSPEAPARARELVAAYEILGDPVRRADYDSLGTLSALFGSVPTPAGWENWYQRATHCTQCGQPLHGLEDSGLSATGRFKRRDAATCSNACRQRAYRESKRARKS